MNESIELKECNKSLGKNSIFSDRTANPNKRESSKSVLQVFRSNKESLFGSFKNNQNQGSNLIPLISDVKSCDNKTSKSLFNSNPTFQNPNPKESEKLIYRSHFVSPNYDNGSSKQLKSTMPQMGSIGRDSIQLADSSKMVPAQPKKEGEAGRLPTKEEDKENKRANDSVLVETQDLLSKKSSPKNSCLFEVQPNQNHLVNINRIIMNTARSNYLKSDDQILPLLDDLKERFRKETLKKNIIMLANEDILCELQNLRKRVVLLENENCELKKKLRKEPEEMMVLPRLDQSSNIQESFLTSKKSKSFYKFPVNVMKKKSIKNNSKNQKSKTHKRTNSLKIDSIAGVKKRIKSVSKSKTRAKNNLISLTNCRSNGSRLKAPLIPSHSKSTLNRKRPNTSSKFFKSIQNVFNSKTNLLDSKIKFLNKKLETKKKKKKFFLFNSHKTNKKNKSNIDKEVHRNLYSHSQPICQLLHLRKPNSKQQVIWSVGEDGLRSFCFRKKSRVIFHSQMDQIISNYSQAQSLLNFKISGKVKTKIDKKMDFSGIDNSSFLRKKNKGSGYHTEVIYQKVFMKDKGPNCLAVSSNLSLFMGSNNGSILVHANQQITNKCSSIDLNKSIGKVHFNSKEIVEVPMFKSRVSSLCTRNEADSDHLLASDSSGSFKISAISYSHPENPLHCVYSKKYKNPIGSIDIDTNTNLMYCFGFRDKNKIKIFNISNNKCISNLTLKGEDPARRIRFGSNSLLWYIATTGASFCDLRIKNPVIKVYSPSDKAKSVGLTSVCETKESQVVFGGGANTLHFLDLRKPKLLQKKVLLGCKSSYVFVSDVVYDSVDSVLFAGSSNGDVFHVDYGAGVF